MSREASYDAYTWTDVDEVRVKWTLAFSLLCSAELGDVLALSQVEDLLVLRQFTGPAVGMNLWVGRPVQTHLFQIGVDIMTKVKVESLRRMGAGGVAAGSLSPATVNTVVRRLGHVLRSALQVMETNLRNEREDAAAERLVLMLEPLVDELTAFDVSRETVRFEKEDVDET